MVEKRRTALTLLGAAVQHVSCSFNLLLHEIHNLQPLEIKETVNFTLPGTEPIFSRTVMISRAPIF